MASVVSKVSAENWSLETLQKFLWASLETFMQASGPPNWVRRVCDAGCGKMQLSRAFFPQRAEQSIHVVGVDAKPEVLAFAQAQGFLTEAVQQDMVEYLQQCQKSNSTFDVLLFLDSLEHVDKSTGVRLLQVAETLSRLILVFSPEGECVRCGPTEWDQHRAVWTREDFVALEFDRIWILENFHLSVGGKDALVACKHCRPGGLG